jgi:flagellar capping protein FliD
MGAWRVKAGRVVDSKYIGVYEENVQETITKLEKRIEILQKRLDKQKARIEK